MKSLLLIFVACLLSIASFCQKNYWQQEVNFNINVSLNDREKSLQAFENIEYTNNSPDTLQFIWFHIWPNAYKNDRTAFSEQLLKNGRTDFYFSDINDRGYINQLEFKVDGNNASFESQKNNIDVIKLFLPQPLAPGKKATISTPFHVKLPKYFSRSGYVGNDYNITQWFPKPAVYDNKGWHQMPYLDQGEFYSEFGNFDVQITAPSDYVIAATGILQDEKTLQELKNNGKPTTEGNTKTWRFKQNNIQDFAWFASKDFIVKHDTVILESKKVVDVFSYNKAKDAAWKNSITYIKEGLRNYSNWIGDYPYSVASVVEGDYNISSGGMEYPTISLITTHNDAKELEITIVHEVGHNWFYGALANNERDNAWMDEGINSYYETRYKNEKFPSSTYLKKKVSLLDRKLPDNDEDLLLRTYVAQQKDQPISTASQEFTSENYSLIVYYKASKWLEQLEDKLGRQTFDKAMHNYYDEWKFKHPQPQDFKASLEKTCNCDLQQNFNQLNKTGLLQPAPPRQVKLTGLYNLNKTDKYNYISVAPAIGFNNYDKLMLGGLVHNYQLPLKRFHFFAAVLKATRSKKWNEFAHVSYNTYKRNYNFETSLGYGSYSQNDFSKIDNTTLFPGIKRLVPSVKLTLFDKDPTSTRRFTFQWKTFILKEDHLNFITVYTPTDTVDDVNIGSKTTVINRLSATVSDARVLYPYNVTFSADQGKSFIRAGITAKYFFNYADGKSGMSARFFAGKFIYLTPKTFASESENERYFLNLSAPKGAQDYTYSDYFVGRNEFELNGWKSQQIMERDGFFKVNTNLYSFGVNIGETDDWLTSVNLVTDIPDKVNPLSILPIKIPLKLFADVGTYSEAWKDNPASGRFVYDAGIQLTILKSLVNIYVPILYSKVYSNYYKSIITQNRFLRTISFNIDLSQFQLKKLFSDLPL